MVASSCGKDANVSINYELTFTNGGGWWTNQFGFDEQGLPLIFAFLGILSLPLVIFYALASVWWYHDHPSTNIFRLSFVSISLYCFCQWALVAHFVVYGFDGVGLVYVRVIADGCGMTARVIMAAVMMLFAHNMGLFSSIHMPLRSKIFIVLVTMALGLTQFVLFIWMYTSWNTAGSPYHWESGPGIFVLLLFVCVGLVVLWGAIQTSLAVGRSSHFNDMMRTSVTSYLDQLSTYLGGIDLFMLSKVWDVRVMLLIFIICCVYFVFTLFSFPLVIIILTPIPEVFRMRLALSLMETIHVSSYVAILALGYLRFSHGGILVFRPLSAAETKGAVPAAHVGHAYMPSAAAMGGGDNEDGGLLHHPDEDDDL